jgi:hypothetical protein
MAGRDDSATSTSCRTQPNVLHPPTTVTDLVDSMLQFGAALARTADLLQFARGL